MSKPTRNQIYLLAVPLLSLIGLHLSATPAWSVSMFTPLGGLLGEPLFSSARGISSDGNVVGGIAGVGQFHVAAVAWREGLVAEKLADQPLLPNGNSFTVALSRDGGSTLITYGSRDTDRGYSAIVNDQGILTDLGHLTDGVSTNALAASVDLNAACGISRDAIGNPTAFRWTRDEGISALFTDDEEGVLGSIATAMSDDGKYIAGTRYNGDSNEAFIWTAETGAIGMGDLVPFPFNSRPEDMSDDGTVVVGLGSLATNRSTIEAFRWTAETGMQALGLLNTDDGSSAAEFVSSDGSTVFGLSFDEVGGSEAFIWDAARGMRSFRSVMETDYGLQTILGGWTGLEPTNISRDGLTLVGFGLDPSGNQQGWRIRLSHPIAVPEPATFRVCLGILLILCFYQLRTTRPQ